MNQDESKRCIPVHMFRRRRSKITEKKSKLEVFGHGLEERRQAGKKKDFQRTFFC